MMKARDLIIAIMDGDDASTKQLVVDYANQPKMFELLTLHSGSENNIPTKKFASHELTFGK